MQSDLSPNKQQSSATEPSGDMVILGRISGVHGVRGWLKVYSYTDPMEAIVNYSSWYMRPANRRSSWQPVVLKQGKRHAKTVVVQLEGCDDRNQAQAYSGYEIAITADQLAALNGLDEFYWRDLIGLQVVNLQGVHLGSVTGLMETGANDVLVVAPAQLTDSRPASHLIPWSFEHVIVSVDLKQSLITVDWQEEWSD